MYTKEYSYIMAQNMDFPSIVQKAWGLMFFLKLIRA